MLVPNLPFTKVNKHLLTFIHAEIKTNDLFKNWGVWCAQHGIKEEVTVDDVIGYIQTTEDKQLTSDALTPLFDMVPSKTKHDNTKPNKFTLFISLAYVHMLGYRWKKYETLDGIVMGLEKSAKVTSFPMIIRSVAIIALDFHRLSGQHLWSVLKNQTYTEIAFNESSLYISL